MEKWFLNNSYENYNRIKNNANFTKIQKILLANRDITDDYKLDTIKNSDIEKMHSSLLLKDIKKGVDLLLDILMQDKNIRIVGDYDQDGVSSTVILYKGLSKLTNNISYFIPDRVDDGYGINKNIVDKCIEDNIDLIITCDNGIAAFDAIDYAKENNIKVIITDHHEIVRKDNKDILPNADAIINPHREDDTYPFKNICGALVSYKFIEAIYRLYGDKLALNIKDIYPLLQFAALGTVCDMMKIIDENRIVVMEGLKYLNQTNNSGVRSLLKELNWNKDIDIYTIGFLIGPTINASGRLYTAKLGVELFLEDDINITDEYAKTLVELNSERKDLTKTSLQKAIDIIEYEKLHDNDIIILYENSIHESLCGLVAGRVKDIYNRPTIILTDSSEDNIIKGSGRSIKSYDMFNNLNNYRDMYVAFGGHEMACGLSLYKKDLDEFSNRLNLDSNLSKDDFLNEINIDLNISFKHINEKFINEITELEPFGYGFQTPIFATKNVYIKDIKILGKNKNVIKLILENDNRFFECISFNIDHIKDILRQKYNLDDLYLLNDKTLDIVYKLGFNEFNGNKTIQLNLVTMR